MRPTSKFEVVIRRLCAVAFARDISLTGDMDGLTREVGLVPWGIGLLRVCCRILIEEFRIWREKGWDM